MPSAKLIIQTEFDEHDLTQIELWWPIANYPRVNYNIDVKHQPFQDCFPGETMFFSPFFMFTAW